MSVFPSQTNFVTGDILTATAVNEIGQAINLLEGAQYAAAVNKIINGDYGVWQRGTSFTVNNAAAYTADRFLVDNVGNATVSQQTFTPGAAPVAGYEGQFFLRFNQTSGGAAFLIHRIEDVRQFAGQTITVSVYAKGAAALNLAGQLRQNFGSGGSATVNTTLSTQAITTSWARYSWTVAVPSITGKTVGTSSYLEVRLDLPSSGTFTFDVWGLQAEAASTASNFQTATGTKQGELAACRYYYSKFDASTSAGNDGAFSTGLCYSATVPIIPFSFPQMRVRPSFAASGTFELVIGGSVPVVTALGVAFDVSTFSISMTGTVTGLVAGQACVLRTGTSTAGVIELSAEL